MSILLLCLSVFSVSHFFAQISPNKTKLESKEFKLKQVFENTKKIINKNKDNENVERLAITFQCSEVSISGSRKAVQKMSYDYSTKISLESLDKIRLESYVELGTNQQFTTQIFNQPKYYYDSEVLIDGKPFNFGSNLSSISPAFTKEQRVSLLKRDIFFYIFPITFNTVWFKELEFKYLGIAESKDGLADIVEVIKDENTTYQLFIDTKTHLLLMIYEKVKNKEKETILKYYFSDYKETNGLLVAQNIIVYRDDAFLRQCKPERLEINSSFKSNLFEIKEEKINPF